MANTALAMTVTALSAPLGIAVSIPSGLGMSLSVAR